MTQSHIDQAKLNEWWEITQRLEVDKLRETELRKDLFGMAFPDPTEGSVKNKVNLSDGYILQGDYKINRTLDQAVISTLSKGDNTRPLVDTVIKYNPALILPAWKKLSDVDRALLADMVTEKPGTPALSIVKPKRG